MKPTVALRSFLFGSSVLATATSLHAANLYWDGTTPASWNTATNWSTVSGATTPDPSAIPGILDDVFFNMASGTGTKLVQLSADQSAKSLSFSYTGGTVNIVGGGAQRTLTIGAGGLTMAAGSSVLFGNGGASTNRALINLTSGAQTWTNNSTGHFTMANAAAAFTRDVGATLNFNKVTTGNFVISTTEMPLTNGIAGNWAFNGTGASMRYATVTTGNIASYTTATSQTFSTVNSATTNYTTSLVESLGINANLTANTLHYTGTGGLYDYNDTGTVSWLYTVNGILATGASGALTFQRGGGVNNTSTMRIGDTNELVIAGRQNVTFNQLGISGATASTGSLTYSGTGTLTLSVNSTQAASTYGAGTTVNSGTVTLSGAFATLGASTGSLTMNGGILNMSTTNNLTVGTLAGVGGTINITNARTLTVNQTTAGTYAGVISGAGGAFTLGASSTNTLTLTGTNDYTDATTISAGTLALGASGTIDNTSSVTLGGGTFDVSAKGGSGYNVLNLRGNGSVAGTINVTTQLAIGGAANAATINFANLALSSGTTAVFDLTGGGSAADVGYVSGTLDLASATLDLVQLGTYTLNNKFTLFAYDGALSGTFSGLIDGANFNDADGQWQINYDDNSAGLNGGTGSLYVTVTAIPEPRAALLGGLGMLMLLRRRRH